jgi:hypothetical protein
VTTRDVEDIYTLSPIQAGILFHALSNEESRAFLEQGIGTLRGRLDAAAFASAWREVIARHPVLRSSFVWQRVAQPLQIVHREIQAPLDQLDWRSLDESERSRRLTTLIASERAAGVSLDLAPLMRMVLIRTEEHTHELLWTIHHLIHDSWSTSILLHELFRIYESVLSGVPHNLAPPRPYREYVRWMKGRDQAGAEAFWGRYLRGISPTALPAGMRLDAIYPGEAHERRERTLPEYETETILAAARSARLTLNTIVQGTWAILLANRGADEIVFGRVVSGRPPEIAGVAGMVGPFINTLPLRVQIGCRHESCVAWMTQIQAAQGEESQFEYTPLPAIRKWSALQPGERLFNSIVVFQNSFGDPSRMSISGIKLSNLRYEGYPNDPLMLRVWPGRTLKLELSYARSLCHAAVADQMLSTAHHCLSVFARDGNPSLEKLIDSVAEYGAGIRVQTTTRRRQSIAAKIQTLARG